MLFTFHLKGGLTNVVAESKMLYYTCSSLSKYWNVVTQTNKYDVQHDVILKIYSNFVFQCTSNQKWLKFTKVSNSFNFWKRGKTGNFECRLL